MTIKQGDIFWIDLGALTVDKSDLVEKIGSLPLPKIKEIIEGVKLLIEPREI